MSSVLAQQSTITRRHQNRYVKMGRGWRAVKFNAPEENPFDRIPRGMGYATSKPRNCNTRRPDDVTVFHQCTSSGKPKKKKIEMENGMNSKRNCFFVCFRGCRGCLSARNQCKKSFLLSLHFVKHERHFSRFSPFVRCRHFPPLFVLWSDKKGERKRDFPINGIIIIFMNQKRGAIPGRPT